MVFLVVPAGGAGARMGGAGGGVPGIPKQFMDYGGEPLLRATIGAFFAPGMPKIEGIAIALPPDRIAEVEGWRFPAPHWCTAGGSTRQESVARALALLPDLPDAVALIHDAARPFPPAGPTLEAVRCLDGLDGLGGCDCAVLAEASTDTLKRVDKGLNVLATEPRETIYRAQTPQAARLGTWREAVAWAESRGFRATDDASALEAMGRRVRIVPSPPSNWKLTVPEDLGRLPRPPEGPRP
jgi:2-C-methyl-D-erythritol 4-phosphate cytidylyltransferase